MKRIMLSCVRLVINPRRDILNERNEISNVAPGFSQHTLSCHLVPLPHALLGGIPGQLLSCGVTPSPSVNWF